MTKKRSLIASIISALVLLPYTAFAHEVYVLNHGTIDEDTMVASPNPFSAITGHKEQFLLWAFLCILLVVFTLFFSLTKAVEKTLDRPLEKLKRYAPLVARITFGTCLIASGYFHALFGPELPFSSFVGDYSTPLSFLLMALGVSIICGFLVRLCSLIMLVVYIFAIYKYGVYMTTYANYLGEILINLILGAGILSLDSVILKKASSLFRSVEEYAFLSLRVLFGIAVIFASFFAKFLHSQLALDTVINYHLTNYFHFEPLFIVLGAFIIEFLIGLFFIIGFEVRLTALVFLTFLGLSLSYFGEAVWPHIVLIGVNVALFMHGYDKFTIEKKLFKQKGLEPVL